MQQERPHSLIFIQDVEPTQGKNPRVKQTASHGHFIEQQAHISSSTSQTRTHREAEEAYTKLDSKDGTTEAPTQELTSKRSKLHTQGQNGGRWNKQTAGRTEGKKEEEKSRKNLNQRHP